MRAVVVTTRERARTTERRWRLSRTQTSIWVSGAPALRSLVRGSPHHAASGGAAIGSEILCRSSRKLRLDVAALTLSKGASHVAAHDAFAPCARRLQRGARQGLPTRSLRATSAERRPRGLRAHSGSCQSASKNVVICIALSFLRADTSRRRTNTHHPHIICHLLHTVSYCAAYRIHAHQLLTKSATYAAPLCLPHTGARASARTTRALHAPVGCAHHSERTSCGTAGPPRHSCAAWSRASDSAAHCCGCCSPPAVPRSRRSPYV